MGQISTLFVHKLVAAATTSEPGEAARRRALFRSVGVDPDAPIDPKRMILDERLLWLCERVAHEDAHGVSVPLRVGCLHAL